jgi:hypothetical protein
MQSDEQIKRLKARAGGVDKDELLVIRMRIKIETVDITPDTDQLVRAITARRNINGIGNARGPVAIRHRTARPQCLYQQTFFQQPCQRRGKTNGLESDSPHYSFTAAI